MVVKQICYDEQTGRLILSDSDNNHYLCDIFGERKKEFKIGITGVATNRHFEKKNLKINFNEDVNSYLPMIRKFEGYSHFPSPKESAFFNIPNYEINTQARNRLIKTLKKHFTNSKVTADLFKKESPMRYEYLCAPLSKNEQSVKDKQLLLDKIEEYFEEFRKENKYKLNLMQKNPKIKALTRLKEYLNVNEDLKIINKRRFKAPTKQIQEKFNRLTWNLRGSKNAKNTITDNLTKNSQIKICPSNLEFKESDNISCISKESQNEIRYREQNLDIKLKGNLFLSKSLNREKAFIEGFNEYHKKEGGIIRKLKGRTFKTNSEFYIENINLLKKGMYFLK
jgi:hypothetical protein